MASANREVVLQKLVTSVGTNLVKGPYPVSGCEIWQQVFDGYPLPEVAPCERTAVAPRCTMSLGMGFKGRRTRYAGHPGLARPSVKSTAGAEEGGKCDWVRSAGRQPLRDLKLAHLLSERLFRRVIRHPK